MNTGISIVSGRLHLHKVKIMNFYYSSLKSLECKVVVMIPDECSGRASPDEDIGLDDQSSVLRTLLTCGLSHIHKEKKNLL